MIDFLKSICCFFGLHFWSKWHNAASLSDQLQVKICTRCARIRTDQMLMNSHHMNYLSKAQKDYLKELYFGPEIEIKVVKDDEKTVYFPPHS